MRYAKGLLPVLALWGSAPLHALAQGALPACSAVADPTYTGSCTATASVYRFTLRRMQLRSTSGTLVTIASGDQTFDVAQVGAGQAVGSYASGAAIPVGTYDAMVPTIQGTWTVRASYRSNVQGGVLGDCVTTATGASANPADEAEMSSDLAAFFTANPGFTPPDMAVSGSDLVITDTSAAGLPLTVANGDSVELKITFDVSTGVKFDYVNGSCTDARVGPLGVTLSLTKN